MLRTHFVRALGAVPILFALVVSQCQNGEKGFAVSLSIGGLRAAASPCHAPT
jgi:hypothetical protein